MTSIVETASLNRLRIFKCVLSNAVTELHSTYISDISELSRRSLNVLRVRVTAHFSASASFTRSLK
jgi:hypothetical protein